MDNCGKCLFEVACVRTRILCGYDSNIHDDMACPMFRNREDYVKVLRCSECRHHSPCEVSWKIWCRRLSRYKSEDGFCSESEVSDDKC